MDIGLALSCSVIYHLASLYAQALDANKDSTNQFAIDWDVLSKRMIHDIGELHKLWNTHKPSASHMESLVGSQRRGELLEKRFKKLESLMNVWVLPRRWIRIILRCENQWLNFLARASDSGLMPEALYQPVVDATNKRCEILTLLLQQAKMSDQATSDNYGIPTDISKVG